jgi:hypothetical protein
MAMKPSRKKFSSKLKVFSENIKISSFMAM